jgi:predicted DNA-binding transcriptional regulator AlpA
MSATADTGTPERLWTRRDLAAFLGVSPRSVERWEYEGTAPPCIRIGKRARRYDPRAVLRWLESRSGRRNA